MTIFTKEDKQRLDLALLKHASITKYHREEILSTDIQWLHEHKYKVIDVACSKSTTIPKLLKEIGSGLEFPSYFQGNSLDAFDDFLYSIQIPRQSGTVIIFRRYDLVIKSEPIQGWQILNILDMHSRLNLLYGLRFITLVQSSDPRLEINAVGCQNIEWNSKEWLDSQRSH